MTVRERLVPALAGKSDKSRLPARSDATQTWANRPRFTRLPISYLKRKNPRSDGDYDRYSKLQLKTRIEKFRSVQAEKRRGVHEREAA